MPDNIDLVFREAKAYFGDGRGTPSTYALPLGNPASGPHIPSKAEIRGVLKGIQAQAVDALNAAPRFEHQVLVGNGTQTSWTLNFTPSGLSGMDVSIAGETLTPGVDYFLDGPVITFAPAIPNASSALVRYHVGATGSTDSAVGKIVSLRSMGASGLVDQDASDIIEAALALNPTEIHGEPGAVYRVTRAIRHDGRAVIEGNGCTVYMANNAACIRLVGGWDSALAVSTITQIGTTSYIRVSSTSGLNVGDILKIVSEDPVPFHPTGSTGLKMGEYIVIQSIDGAVIRVAGRLLYPYNLASTCRVARARSHEIRVNNVTFDSPPGVIPTSGATRYQTPLVVYSAVSPILTNIRSKNLTESVLRVVSCYAPVVRNMTNRFGADQAETPYSNNSGVVDGDLLEISGCWQAHVSGVHGQLCRHTVAVNGSPVSLDVGSNALDGYGPSFGTTISDSTAFRCTSAGFDTHEGSFFTHYADCHTAFGKRVGFSARGVGNDWTGCSSFMDDGGLAVSVGSAFVATSITNFNRWKDGRVINPVGRAFRIDDNGGTLFIDGGSLEFIGGTPINGVDYVSTENVMYDMAGAFATNIVISGEHMLYVRNADLSTMTRIFLDRGSVSGRIAIHSMIIDTGGGSVMNCPLIVPHPSGTSLVHMHRINLRLSAGTTIPEIIAGNTVSANSYVGHISSASGFDRFNAPVGFHSDPSANALDAQFGVEGPGEATRIAVTCASDYTGITSRTAGGAISNRVHLSFRNSNGRVGAITTQLSGTAYATTSDGALKINRAPLADEVDLDARLRLVVEHLQAYDWLSAETMQATGERGYGLIAQEVDGLWPGLVTPRIGEPGAEDWQPASIDYARLVPLLLGVVARQNERLAALETKSI